MRFDARGFVIAEDEHGNLWRAYTIENRSTRERLLFWAREESLEGFQAPEDFLDTYGKKDDGEEVFGPGTHEARFEFAEEA